MFKDAVDVYKIAMEAYRVSKQEKEEATAGVASTPTSVASVSVLPTSSAGPVAVAAAPVEVEAVIDPLAFKTRIESILDLDDEIDDILDDVSIDEVKLGDVAPLV